METVTLTIEVYGNYYVCYIVFFLMNSKSIKVQPIFWGNMYY